MPTVKEMLVIQEILIVPGDFPLKDSIPMYIKASQSDEGMTFSKQYLLSRFYLTCPIQIFIANLLRVEGSCIEADAKSV